MVKHFVLGKTQSAQEQTRKEIPQGERGKQHHPKEEKEEGSTIQEEQQTKKHHPEGARGKQHHTNEGGGESSESLKMEKKTRNKFSIKKNEAAPPKRREEKEQHPRGATRTTPTKEEKPAQFKRVERKAAPPKRRLSLLPFFFLFSIPCRVCLVGGSQIEFRQQKRVNFQTSCWLFSQVVKCLA